MMWETVTWVDWGFIILPPLLLIYLGYHLVKDYRERKGRQIAEEIEFEASLNETLEKED